MTRPVRIGCSGWNYQSWKETFYPPRLPARRWLEYYATQFDTVEVNATFYRLASPSAGDGWGDHTPPGLVFAVQISPPPAGLRVRDQILPLPDPHEAADRHGSRGRPLLRLDRADGRVAQARPGAVAAARPLRARRRAARARVVQPPAREARVRAAPPVVVRGAGLGPAAPLRGRVRASRRQTAPPDTRGADRGFHLPALPLRPPRPPRQLLRHRARGVGRAPARFRAPGVFV